MMSDLKQNKPSFYLVDEVRNKNRVRGVKAVMRKLRFGVKKNNTKREKRGNKVDRQTSRGTTKRSKKKISRETSRSSTQ